MKHVREKMDWLKEPIPNPRRSEVPRENHGTNTIPMNGTSPMSVDLPGKSMMSIRTSKFLDDIIVIHFRLLLHTLQPASEISLKFAFRMLPRTGAIFAMRGMTVVTADGEPLAVVMCVNSATSDVSQCDVGRVMCVNSATSDVRRRTACDTWNALAKASKAF